MTGQPEPLDGPLTADPADIGHRVVVEAAGQLDPQPGGSHPRHDVVAETPRPGQGRQCVGGQGQAEGLGQARLDRLALVAEPLPVGVGVLVLGGRQRVGRGGRQHESARGVEDARVGQLQGGLGSSDELRVQSGQRALDPGVQAVEPGGGVGQIPPDRYQAEGQHDPQVGTIHHGRLLPPRRKRPRTP